MKFNVGIFFLSDLQSVGRLGQKHVPSLFVFCQVHGLPRLEVVQLCLIRAGDPGGLVERDGLIAARGIILM